MLTIATQVRHPSTLQASESSQFRRRLLQNGGPEVRGWHAGFISKYSFEFMRIDGIFIADKLECKPELSCAIFKKMHELKMG